MRYAFAVLLAALPAAAEVPAEGELKVALAPAALAPAALDRVFDAAHPRPEAVLSAPTKPAGPACAKTCPVSKPAARLVVPVPTPSPAYQHTFRVLLAHPETTDAYDLVVLRQARRYGVDPRLIKAIIAAESEFIRHATSPRGALGLMQLMPSTAEEMGVPASQLQRPVGAIRAGAAYLATLFKAAWKRFHLDPKLPFSRAPLWVVERVIAAYNAGPRFLFQEPLYRETKEYVRKVMLFLNSPVSLVRRAPLAPGPTLPPVASHAGTLP